MKTSKLLLTTLLVFMVGFVSCNDYQIEEVRNPNSPTPDVLSTEEGMFRAARGVYETLNLDPPSNFIWVVQGYHEMMGDALATPWGNWQFRWVHQVARMTYQDGTVITPPDGATQPEEMVRVNNRQQGSNAAVVQEWSSMYYLNNQANMLLANIESTEFSGSPAQVDAKRRGVIAWANFWKGYAYSRIGSMYEEGLILDEYNVASTDYVSRDAILAEAARCFGVARDNASGFDDVASSVVPSLMTSATFGFPSGSDLIQACNTMEARNILVNKLRSQMTAADWNQILTLTGNGVSDNTNTIVMRTDNATFPDFWWIFQAAWGNYGWHRMSERLIDDFQAGDARLSDVATDAGTWNTRGRGTQYNSRQRVESRWATLESTEDDLAWYFVSQDENLLMRAEALLETGDPAGAAALIDQVRTLQGANLPAISDTSPANVLDQLYSERRVGLFLRGLAFYDARRFNIIQAFANGGVGKRGTLVTGNDASGNAVIQTDVLFEYNYLEYWPIPDEELTFNPKTGGSAGSPS